MSVELAMYRARSASSMFPPRSSGFPPFQALSRPRWHSRQGSNKQTKKGVRLASLPLQTGCAAAWTAAPPQTRVPVGWTWNLMCSKCLLAKTDAFRVILAYPGIAVHFEAEVREAQQAGFVP